MKVIIGLGNPGSKYINTRHNAGFILADMLCEYYGGRWKKAFLRPFLYAVFPDPEFVLIKPLTYMNRSGSVLPFLQSKFSLDSPDDILVLVDNMDLPCAKARLKKGGSSAGHNGLKSLISSIGDSGFSRLYIGIGRGEDSVIDYVLGDFSQQQIESLNSNKDTVIEACRLWLSDDSKKAMEVLNGRQKFHSGSN
ncbi:aminoacyl-tRNA hydrolase [Spirochaeta dissipatitropha]